MGRSRCWAGGLLAGLLLAATLAPQRAVRAADAIEDELGPVADDFARVIKSLDEDTVTVGPFTPPSRSASTGGPGIVKPLIDALEARGLKVKADAPLTLRGDYTVGEDRETRAASARIRFVLVDRLGKNLHEKPYNVKGVKAFCALFGVTGEISSKDSLVERRERMARINRSPTTTYRGPRVAAGKASPYAIEVLVKDGAEYKTREARDDDGLAFVNIERGESYAVKVYNDTDMDAAVSLFVDGLNVFAFSAQRDYSYFILPARSAGIIYGWHRNSSTSESFQVVKYADSAVASLLKSPSAAVGTITACFAAAWPATAPPPRDENAAVLASRGGPASATGRGPQIATNYKEVERRVGELRAAISVRYVRAE